MVRIAAFAGLALVSADFDDFKARYGKVYNGDDEDSFRATYDVNMKWAAENSSPDLTFGENQFADLTQEQYKIAAGLGYVAASQKYGALPHLGVHTHNGEKLADSIDWTTQGAVTAVKDQGGCGSCWAFSSTGGLEGAWQVGTGQLTSMSEQYLVDCTTNAGEGGCDGGSMENAFVFVHGNGIATEASYPYTATDGSCQSGFTEAIPAGAVAGYMSVDQSTEGLQSALQSGPVSIAIEADQASFQHYTGGVLSSKLFASCGTRLDHGVLAVGYDSESFTVKNSWGSSWGADGYLKISNKGNTCGIHSDASYPVVTGSVAV